MYELAVSLDLAKISSVLMMLVFISVLIIAHELGHFWVARRCGIRVERFGFGLPIGPTLWKKKIGDVEYCIHACLFGGYVAFPDDDPDNPLPKDSPERFENQPIGARFAVMVAGVTVNAILGWLIMAFVIIGWGMPTLDVAVGKALQNSPAERAGLKSGDIIVAIADKPVEGYMAEERINNVRNTIARYAGKPVNVTVLRDRPGAAKSANNPVSKKEPQKISADTPKDTMNVRVTPNEKGLIGIYLAGVDKTIPVKNPLMASKLSYDFLAGMVKLQMQAFGRMFQGKMDIKELSGPIQIVNVGSDQIQKNGIQRGLMLTAIISVILAVMNLLPIPALDGGHIFFLLVEAIKGSPVKQEFREQVTQIGFLGLLGLIAFILLNDINNTFINPIKLP